MCFLFQCLQKLGNNDQKNEILVPGYTCYSVASSAIMAGLKVRICDIDPDTLSYDLEQLNSVDFSRVLCVVTANLYGLPDDLQQIEQILRANKVYLVDDAAQCLGGLVEGRPSGTFGIAGLYSLDKGKNITSLQGGIIVTNDDDLAGLLQQEYQSLAENSPVDNTLECLKILIYFFFLHPAMYWIPSRLPFLNLGQTRYENDYPINKYPGQLATLALAQLRRHQTITATRLQAARWYQEHLPQHQYIRMIQPVPNTDPVWLRFPLRITAPRVRERFLQLNSNMGCTGSYPSSIAEIPEIRGHMAVQNGQFSVSKMISREIVTLPTHTFVREQDVESIGNSLRILLSSENPD